MYHSPLCYHHPPVDVLVSKQAGQSVVHYALLVGKKYQLLPCNAWNTRRFTVQVCCRALRSGIVYCNSMRLAVPQFVASSGSHRLRREFLGHWTSWAWLGSFKHPLLIIGPLASPRFCWWMSAGQNCRCGQDMYIPVFFGFIAATMSLRWDLYAARWCFRMQLALFMAGKLRLNDKCGVAFILLQLCMKTCYPFYSWCASLDSVGICTV